MSYTIFVQIACYRDRELIPTVNDLFDKAKNPKNIYVRILNQYNSSEEFVDISNFKSKENIRIINQKSTESLGVCDSRKKLQSFYNNEDFYMQIDSHHRFAKNWDEELISMWLDLKNKGYKPLITAYLPNFQPETHNERDWYADTTYLNIGYINRGNIVIPKPTYVDKRSEPYPAKLVSGHFIFTSGDFCELVPYDDDYFFYGEEINISARSFMAGFDLFHPHKVLLLHQYFRYGQPKVWEDLSDTGNKIYQKTMQKHKEVFGIDGVKTKNTLTKHVKRFREYEFLIGIDFSTGRFHINATQDNYEFPCAKNEDDFNEGLINFKRVFLKIPVHQMDKIPKQKWVLKFLNDDGVHIVSTIIENEELLNVFNETKQKNRQEHYLWKEFISEQVVTHAEITKFSEQGKIMDWMTIWMN